MNEQRTQQYLNLINQLLSCKEGDEPQILQENQQLLDQGLIEVMITVAQQFEEEGRENETQFLMNVAQQLAQALGLLGDENTATANTHQDYLDFLMEVLQKVAENPNPQVIYPFLAENIDKLDDNLLDIFNSWGKETLLSTQPGESEYIADVIVNFSNLVQQFPLGDIAMNLEIAITAYQIALSVFTFEAFPQDWANIKNSIAVAYSNRIKGDKSENLEQAILACQQALQFYILETFPYEWAILQNNLINLYRERIRGDKAENLEQAIMAAKEALKIRTFEDFPHEWAMTQNNLATAYLYRIREDRGENLEQAILACQEALKVYTVDAFPYEWATLQNNLALAYRDRIKGDRAKNLETSITACQKSLQIYRFDDFPVDWARIQDIMATAYSDRIRDDRAENLEIAITYYQEALKVRTFEDFPIDWADTKNNLGNAYSDRIRGDRAENLEIAITYYQEALKVRTFEDFPIDWAVTTHNLGNAYSDRIRGDRAENLEIAITYYQEALKVRTFEDFPIDWAMTQNNLGNTYRDRIRGNKSENIEQAITYLQEALKVRTFEDFPLDWAMTQNNLAIAYRNRIKKDRIKNLEKAIFFYQEALKVYNLDTFSHDWAKIQNNLGVAYWQKMRKDETENFQKAIMSFKNALKIRTKKDDPFNCLQTAYNLANLHYEQKQWQPATEAYNIAIEAVENARLEAFNPQSRQEVLSNAIDVFHRIVEAYLNLNQPEKALEYIERSKGRNLVELMTQKALKPQGVDQEIIDKLAELKQQVVNEQIRLQHQSINQNLVRSDNLTPYVQDQSYLKEYQQELDDFIEKEITPYDENFKLTQKVQPIPFKEIKSLTDDSTCLLQWYITGEKILAFIVSANETVKVWQSSEDDRNQLINTLNNYIQLYYSEKGKQEWINKLPNLLRNFADILNINHIISLIPETCQRLIIIPHWFLHILPIHALPINKNYILQDKYDIQYAPSCQLLQITKQRPLNQLTNLFAIQNPRKDLIFTDLEVNMISSLFSQKEIIAKDNAVENTVTNKIKVAESHCYHFSCHGSFNPDNPLDSSLLLANKDELTLGEIFELDFKKSRLVVLSACETGLIDLNSISDEYIGLPAGFLFAGSSSVVSSLWTVSDLSSSFLIMKFYEIILDKTQSITIPVALKMAQNWLRNLTVQEFDKLLEKYQLEINKILEQLTPGKKLIFKKQIELTRKRGNYPFTNPYYWSAFFASGV